MRVITSRRECAHSIKGHHTVTKTRERQLAHQLTCRTPRAPSHCRTGSVVDVTATSLPVTDECSRSDYRNRFPCDFNHQYILLCLYLVHDQLLPLERNEALPSCLPASSRTCQDSLFPPHAITAKGWHSQQAHGTSTVRCRPDTHSVFTAPPEAPK